MENWNEKDLPTLLTLYNHHIAVLKEKLLEGVPWQQLTAERQNITDLAVAIHKAHDYVLPDDMAEGFLSGFDTGKADRTNSE